LATNIWNCNFPIIPKHVYEKTWPKDLTLLESREHLALEEHPVVAGPYELVKWTRRQELVLKRRKGYYEYNGKQVRPKPYFAEIRFKIIEEPSTTMLALKRGDIEEYEMSVAQWNSKAADDEFYRLNTKARASEWTYFYFGWNNRHELFNDRNVRLAMAYAYPHHVLLDGLNRKLTEPCLGQFHPTSPMFPKTPLVQYKQDMAKAAALLEEAGWIDTDGDNILDKEVTKLDNKTGKPILDKETGKPITYRRPFEFTMFCSTDPLRIATCNLMKNTLEKLGIVCNVRPLEQTVLFQREMEHDFDAYFGGWGSGADPDTSSNIWTTKAINDGRNFVCYSNKYVDGLYDLAQFEPTSKEARQKIFDEYKLGDVGVAVDTPRMELYAKIHELIYQDQPTTFLYYRNAYFGFSKKLLGYHFSPRGPYHYAPGFSTIWKALD
jgi:peptide/nickel transport system substrate-binding protein